MVEGRFPVGDTTSIWFVTWGSSVVYTDPTRWQRLKIKAQSFKRRVSDAWLVLRGKAYIADDDYIDELREQAREDAFAAVDYGAYD